MDVIDPRKAPSIVPPGIPSGIHFGNGYIPMQIVLSGVALFGGILLLRTLYRLLPSDPDDDKDTADRVSDEAMIESFRHAEANTESRVIAVVDRFWRDAPLPRELEPFIISINNDVALINSLNSVERDCNLILHTRGGSIGANDAMIKALLRFTKKGFKVTTNIPVISQSAGSMLALTGKPIRMNRLAQLTPFDPQMTFEHPSVENDVTYPSYVILESVLRQRKNNEDVDSLVTMAEIDAECYHRDNIDNKDMIMKQHKYEAETSEKVEKTMCKGDKPHTKALDIDDLKEMGLEVIEGLDPEIFQTSDTLLHYMTNPRFNKFAGVGKKNDDLDSDSDSSDSDSDDE